MHESVGSVPILGNQVHNVFQGKWGDIKEMQSKVWMLLKYLKAKSMKLLNSQYSDDNKKLIWPILTNLWEDLCDN